MRVDIVSHRDLNVFRGAMLLQKKVFRLTLRFPREEQLSLTKQARDASRAVPAAIAEAWRKRRYKAHWISKLTDAEQEAAETQVWMEIARDCDYITDAECEELQKDGDHLLAQLVLMEAHPEKWVIPKR